MTSNKDDFLPDMVAEDEPLQPFDVRDSSGRQGLVKLIIGTVILLAIAFLLLKFYQPGTRDRQTPPRITAENTPFKVKPSDAGGMQVPDQDREVFEVMDGKTPDEVVTELKVPETPIELPQRTQPRANIQVDQPSGERTPKAPQAMADVKPRVVAPSVTTNPRTGTSEYVVQVASVRSQADAEAVWRKLESRFSNVLNSGLYADIKRVDLAEKGIYFRTRVAGLADRDAAKSLCNVFKDSNQACYVTKR